MTDCIFKIGGHQCGTHTQILFVVKLRRDIDYYLATLRRHKGHRNQPMGSEIKSSQSVIFPPDT